MILTRNKGYIIGLVFFFALFGLAGTANAGLIPLSQIYQVDLIEPLISGHMIGQIPAELQGHSVSHKSYVTQLVEYDGIGTANHCYPFRGGSTTFGPTWTQSLRIEWQTVAQSGSPSCVGTGTYYTMIKDNVTGDTYYLAWNWDYVTQEYTAGDSLNTTNEVYRTPEATQTHTVIFDGVDNAQEEYVQRLFLPYGETVDRLRFHVPTGATGWDTSVLLAVNAPSTTLPLWTECIDNTCNTSTQYFDQHTVPTQINDNTYEIIFDQPHTAIFADTLLFVLNPNVVSTTTYNEYIVGGAGMTEDGTANNRRLGGVEMILCNGTCPLTSVFDGGLFGGYVDDLPVDVSPLYNTRFDSVTIAGISTTTGTQVTANVSYILDVEEYTVANRPDYIQSSVLKKGFFSDEQITSSNKLLLPLETGTWNKSLTYNHDFDAGNYVAYFSFWNIETNYVTFSRSNVVVEFEIDNNGDVVNTVVDSITDGTTLTTVTPVTGDCGITDLGACFSEVLVYLFYPSDAVLTRFGDLWENISTKKPFGYVTMTISQLSDLDDAGAHAFDLGVIPFQTAIFDPFRIALGTILWALYAIFFYQRRLKHLDI